MDIRPDADPLETLLEVYDAGFACLFPSTYCTADPHVKFYKGSHEEVDMIFPGLQEDLESLRVSLGRGIVYHVMFSRIYPRIGVFQISDMFPMFPQKEIADESLRILGGGADKAHVFFPKLLGHGQALNLFSLNFAFPDGMDVTVWSGNF